MERDDAVPGLSVGPDRAICLQVGIDEMSRGRGRRTLLSFHWHRSDPLAVHLHLTAEPDHPALPRGEWVVLRDSVQRGLERDTGDGVVRLQVDTVRDRVWFELTLVSHGTGRSACVSVPRPALRAFLSRTEEQVPTGEEASDQAVDAFIERLLP